MICQICGAENRNSLKVCRVCFAALKKGSKAERNEEIFRARQAGHKYREIAERYGISRARAHQIYRQQEVLRRAGRNQD